MSRNDDRNYIRFQSASVVFAAQSMIRYPKVFAESKKLLEALMSKRLESD